MIRIVLPFHLQILANCGREVTVEVTGAITQRSVLDALESRYPMLRGTVREHISQQRRPRVRFFVDNTDVSHQPPDAALPESVARGERPFMIVGAVAGG
ncbi:MAG: MoaD/ThiS family protein [Halioglobus sp.]|nr:MoaD/ThiS family protein [Halioglobus sp.]